MWDPIKEGCTTATACNYDATATKDNGNCVSSKLGHSSTVQTEKYTKFEQSELIKDFPIEAVRLCDGGQVLEGSHEQNYNYGKA